MVTETKFWLRNWGIEAFVTTRTSKPHGTRPLAVLEKVERRGRHTSCLLGKVR